MMLSHDIFRRIFSLKIIMTDLIFPDITGIHIILAASEKSELVNNKENWCP